MCLQTLRGAGAGETILCWDSHWTPPVPHCNGVSENEVCGCHDDGGNIHAVIGKQSFDAQKIVDNAEAFIATINRMKPAATKGIYVMKITVGATMTPGVQVEL